MKKIAFTTLGCRFNQHETEEMEQSLRGVLQVVPFTMDADIYVINTCTVTGKSDHKCRQVIRNTAIRAPNSKLVVTGCYAETKGDELGKMAGVSLVVGNLAKSNILGSLKELYQNAPEKSRPFQGGEGDLPDAFPVGVIRNSSRRTSAYLKVQTGCDMACSYCIVSVARGKGQSNPVLNVKKGVEELVRVGVNEIVLTGINLGCYGQDLSPKVSIATLLHELELVKGVRRIRLSSINPNEVSGELINVMKKSKVVCRHLHIPLQSGDNHILKKMRRNYLAEDFRALVEKLHREIKGIGVGTDVIVGFPGETDGAFKNTYSLIKELPLSYLHVFRYSKREGTEAAGFAGQMSNALKKTRSKALIELGTVKKETFRKKHIRKTLRVLFEKRDGKSLGFMTGYTDNYIPVIVEGPKTLGNSIRDVMLVENGVEKVRGVLV